MELEELRALLAPWYLQINFIHLYTVAMWAFSTAVAYRNYFLPVYQRWLRDPDNPARISERNIAMERFDKGAILEHVAFPLVLLSGLTMVWLAGWPWREVSWLTVKLAVVALVFLPMEAVDYYISHFGGNKKKIRQAGDQQRYERMIRYHWQFFRVTTPLVVVFIPLIFYLAITKPL